MTKRYLNDLERRLPAAAPGTTIEAPDIPFLSRYRAGSPISVVASLADYSVQAWAELRFPDRKIRVAWAGSQPPPARSDEVLVLVTRRN